MRCAWAATKEDLGGGQTDVRGRPVWGGVCFSEDQNMGAVLGGEGEEVMPFLFGKTIDVKE